MEKMILMKPDASFAEEIRLRHLIRENNGLIRKVKNGWLLLCVA